MANTRVTLVWHCKTEKGWRRFPVVLKQGRIKKDTVVIDGQERRYTEGHFELRTYEGNKPRYTNVGTESREALLHQEQERNLLAARASGAKIGVAIKTPPQRKTITELKEAFLEMKKLEPHRSEDAGSTYRLTLAEFLQVAGKTYPEQITDLDVLRYCDGVEKRLCDRTRANRFTALKTFLRYCGVDPKAILTREQLKKLKKFTKKEVEVYSATDLTSLFVAAESKPSYRLLFEFMLKTGFRMQECMYLEWGDIDFVNNTVSVRSKQHWNFEPKDAEERSVPLVNGLCEKLQTWQKSRPGTRLVFGTRSDLPNNKMLPKLKRIAKNAKLNCGICPTCMEKQECERFYLHKFRASYATRLLQNGVDIRTVQKLLGHSDLDSTLRYLQPAKGQMIQDRVNAAFD